MKPITKRPITKPSNASPHSVSGAKTGLAETPQSAAPPPAITPQQALSAIVEVLVQLAIPMVSPDPKQMDHKRLQMATSVLQNLIDKTK